MNGCDILQKQNDPAWAGDKLGFSNSSLGGYGCLVTCYSMLFSFAQSRIVTPRAMNETFKTAKKFWKTNMLFIPDATHGIMGNCVKAVGRSVEERRPLSQASYIVLQQWLKADENNFAILKLDFTPASPAECDTHFVLAWGVSRSGNVLANDPAFGCCRSLQESGSWSYYGRTRPVDFYATPQGTDDQHCIWRYDLIKVIKQP